MINRFDKAGFLTKILNKDWHDIIFDTDSAIRSAENIKVKGRDDEYYKSSYLIYVKSIGFFLQSVVKPAGLSDSEFQQLKPLIQNLIDKGQWKAESIKVFDEAT